VNINPNRDNAYTTYINIGVWKDIESCEILANVAREKVLNNIVRRYTDQRF